MRRTLVWGWLSLLLAGCSQVALPPSDPSAPSVLQAQGKKTTPTPAPTACAANDDSNIKAVRFDPSYYYGSGLNAQQLSQTLLQQWAKSGVNTVYFLAYNPTYGARYQTNYPNVIMESWGQQDLMGEMLRQAPTYGMRVIAWLYDYRSGQAGQVNPNWRSLNASGQAYAAGDDQHFLTLASTEAESWYQGFLKDLLTRYPALHGIDLAEPLVNWWGTEADYSQAMTGSFNKAYPGQALGGTTWRNYRSQLLTKHLQNSVRTIRSFCKSVHLTMTLTADAQGQLLPASVLKSETGFDLDTLLNSTEKPDVMNAELIWQQWKAAYGSAVFSPSWTASATQQAKAMIAGRSKLITHVETTDFGTTVTASDLQDSLQAAKQAGADGLDIYHTQRIDQEQAWNQVSTVYAPVMAAAN